MKKEIGLLEVKERKKDPLKCNIGKDVVKTGWKRNAKSKKKSEERKQHRFQKSIFAMVNVIIDEGF